MIERPVTGRHRPATEINCPPHRGTFAERHRGLDYVRVPGLPGITDGGDQGGDVDGALVEGQEGGADRRGLDGGQVSL